MPNQITISVKNNSYTEANDRLLKEESFSPIKYLAVALLLGAIAAALFSVCFPLAVVLIVIAGGYLLSAAVVVINSLATNTSWAPTIHKIHAFTTALHSILKSALLFPLTLFSSYHKPRGDLNGIPILMINGYLSFGSTFHEMRTRLAEEGLGPLYTMNVGSGDSITTYAEHVATKIKEIQAETKKQQIRFVCHSKGGLVALHYAIHLAAQSNTTVTDLITIGSPLAGTPLASLGLGSDAQEMRPDAPFHQTLREKIPTIPSTRLYHIASEVDGVVPLQSALFGTDAARHFVIKDLDHLSLVFSSRVAYRISSWLKH